MGTMDGANVNYRQLGLFVDVVDLGSFSKAAEQHFVTPQSVSQQIRRLEGELGFSLLDRNAQGVVPTDAGRAFYEGGQRIRRDFDLLVARCSEIAAAGRGTIRLGSSASYSLALFARFIPGYLRHHPDARVEYVDVAPNPLGGLLDGTYDVIESVRPAGESGAGAGAPAGSDLGPGSDPNPGAGARQADDRLAFLPLFRSRRCCLVAPRNPLSHRTSIGPEDLRDQRVYVFNRQWAANLQAYLDARCPGIVLLEIPSTDNETVHRILDADDAAYLVPEQLYARFDALVPIPFDADVMTEYGLVYLAESRERLAELLAAAQEEFASDEV